MAYVDICDFCPGDKGSKAVCSCFNCGQLVCPAHMVSVTFRIIQTKPEGHDPEFPTWTSLGRRTWQSAQAFPVCVECARQPLLTVVKSIREKNRSRSES